MKALVYRWQYVLFAAFGTIVVMWQLLLPGYILTLDMVFGPSHVFYMPQGFLNGLPITVLMYLLSYIVPAWVVQKVLLGGIFFALFYVPLRFFPEEFKISTIGTTGNNWIKYFAAILYAINPFVYERFLAGQWEVLAGYALLPLLLSMLLRFMCLPHRRAGLRLAGALLLIGLFSIHTLVMSVIFVGLAILMQAARYMLRRDYPRLLEIIKSTVLLALVFLVVSSYWLVPFIVSHNSPVAGFGSADTAAFMTASDEWVGATGNVALLMGFWGEAYPWGQQFISPKAVGTFGLGALALFTLITIGVVVSLRRTPSGKVALLLMLFMLLAYIFSMGAAGIFHSVNNWLFTHVSLWRGFRDSEKWSMWLALAYAYFAATGAGWIAGKVSRRLRTALICMLFFVPLLYCAPEIGGFYGQLSPVWYPQSWYQINAEIQNTNNCRALFLPWHLYYSLAFDHGVLTADPSRVFFNCNIIAAQNADIGSIAIDATDSTQYEAIDRVVTHNTSQDSTHNSTAAVNAVDVLLQYKIQYIISTGDLAGVDIYDYGFLTDPRVIQLSNSGIAQNAITLYALSTGSPRQPK